MFAPLALPIKITFVVMALLAIVLPRAIGRFLAYPVLGSLSICCVLSIPMLVLVGSIVDSIRYGEFHYPDARQLNDGYVQLPVDATDITLHKYASGHDLKFRTSRASLENWMDDLTRQRLKYSDATPFDLDDSHSEFNSVAFSGRFGRYGWQYPADAVIYRGWFSGRGAGFNVWYSESHQSAFISGSYW